MERRTWLVLFLLAMTLMAAFPAAAQPLTAELAAAGYGEGGGQLLSLTLRNDGADDLQVLSWKTPFQRVDDDLFRVVQEGRRVRYIGKLVKRPAPTDADWVTVPAGGELSGTFSLGGIYAVATGEASISYVLPADAVRTPVQLPEETAPSWRESTEAVVSNAASIWLEASYRPGRQGAGESAEVLPPAYNGCSAGQQALLATALADARKYAANATRFLVRNPVSTARYVRWFGSFTNRRYNLVKRHFTALRTAYDTQVFDFDCTCNEDYYAYVYPGDPYTVYLCNVFWTAPATGQDSKAGTLVHETSHFTVVAATDDYVYGAVNAAKLAVTNPAQAARNADNHEYFCELR